MVVATGVKRSITTVLKGLLLPAMITTATLLRQLGLFGFCYAAAFRCVLSYKQQELPRLVPWRTIVGMRIDLQVVQETCNFENVRQVFAAEDMLAAAS